MLKKIKKYCLVCEKEFISYKSSNRKYCKLECAYLSRSLKNYKTMKIKLNKLNIPFKAWLVGFWEGEGYIFKRPNNRNYSLHISQNDLSVFKQIKNKLKTGSIRHAILPSGNIHYHYHVANLGDTLALAEGFIKFVKIPRRKRQLIKVINFKHSKQIRKYA